MNTKTISVRMNKDLKKALEEAKWDMKLSQNEIVCRAIADFILKNNS